MSDSNTAEQKIAELERELRGVQEMLAFVLQAAGPVVVTREALENGLPANAQIAIDDNMMTEEFTFSLVEVE
jgi:hypothetical protein